MTEVLRVGTGQGAAGSEPPTAVYATKRKAITPCSSGGPEPVVLESALERRLTQVGRLFSWTVLLSLMGVRVLSIFQLGFPARTSLLPQASSERRNKTGRAGTPSSRSGLIVVRSSCELACGALRLPRPS